MVKSWFGTTRARCFTVLAILALGLGVGGVVIEFAGTIYLLWVDDGSAHNNVGASQAIDIGGHMIATALVVTVLLTLVIAAWSLIDYFRHRRNRPLG